MSTRHVTIRIRIGGYELELTGPKKWAEDTIADFIKKRKREAARAQRMKP